MAYVELSIREFIGKLDAGYFKPDASLWGKAKEDQSRELMAEAGWYDWFCKDSALVGRTERYGRAVKAIAKAVPQLMDDYHVNFVQCYGFNPNSRGTCYHDQIQIVRRKGASESLPEGWGINLDGARCEHKYDVYRFGTREGSDFLADRIGEVKAFLASEFQA